jgi:hypothetical protein
MTKVERMTPITFFAIHGLFSKGLIVGESFLFRIRKQNEREIEFLLEPGMGRSRIRAHAHNFDAFILEDSVFVTKPAGFDRTAGGVIFGVKVKNK